jgi:general stress protein CsbA
MERSSRFISLSGLSGISAGISALLGAAAIYWYFDMTPFINKAYYAGSGWTPKLGIEPMVFLSIVATLVLFFALAGGVYFTTQKARKKGQQIWNKLSQKLLLNLLIPLVTGGLFCLALIKQGQFGMVAPATLIFYGLALVNGGKYTLTDIHYLGLSEIALGLLALFYYGYGLEFWTIGFGVLHIIYGAVMYQKYEKND